MPEKRDARVKIFDFTEDGGIFHLCYIFFNNKDMEVNFANRISKMSLEIGVGDYVSVELESSLMRRIEEHYNWISFENVPFLTLKIHRLVLREIVFDYFFSMP